MEVTALIVLCALQLLGIIWLIGRGFGVQRIWSWPNIVIVVAFCTVLAVLMVLYMTVYFRSALPSWPRALASSNGA